MSRYWLGLLCLAVLPGVGEGAQAEPAQEAVRRLTEAAGAPVSVVRSPETGGVTFLSVPAGEGIPVLASPTASAESRALAFMGTHGEAFFIRDKSQLVLRKAAARDEAGLEHVRLQQVHLGVPVTGAELIVHMRGDRVTAVAGHTLDGLADLDVEPTVAAADAQETVRTVVGGKDRSVTVTLSEPRLEVFNRGLLEERRYPTRLAWFVEAAGFDRREFVWVDAKRGTVLLRFSQLPHALNRAVYSAGGLDVLPGTLIRSEGGPATGDVDGNAAYDYAGHAYNYFLTNHGRDSFNGTGGQIRSTVDYCQTGSPCPYANAFWNGTQLAFGDQMSLADDVVAHEFTHGVVEFTANLFYYMQSGALNEAFADIFGESTDQTNGVGTDTVGNRWLMGEDLFLGVGRNMMTPTALGDPGKMSDPQFVCATPGGDAGGVHSNSGVLNHAYALMTDGGTYNGRTVTGVGLAKAGKVAYRALDRYLVSASGFLDTYNAFKQACFDLVGVAGITTADCWQVQTAMDAVELANPWPCPGTPARIPALCPLGQAATNHFFDNIDGGAGNWGVESATVSGPNAWFLGDLFASSEPFHLLGLNQDVVTHGRLIRTAPQVVPAGARLQFNHAYGFETDAGGFYDGGVLEYRNETGPGPWLDAGALFAAGTTYDGPIVAGFGNPLAGRQAFAGHSFGYTGSQYNLSSLAGQNTRFGFRIGTDSSVGDFGWYIDDVRLYTCAAPSDLIFANGFDANNMSSWLGGAVTDGGDLTTSAAAAMAGSAFGLRGVIDDVASIYVQDDSPNNEPRYRARFYIDPETFDPGEAEGHQRTRVFIGFDATPQRRVLAVVLRRVAGQYALMGRARLDSNAQADTGFFNITNAPHAVEIEWVASSGPDDNNGTFEMWIDGLSVRKLTGLDNSISGMDFARLGALSVKSGASGVMFWDHFDSRKQTYVGP